MISLAGRPGDLAHEHRFNVDELLYAIGGEFAPIATLFDAAKGQTRIRLDKGVDEASSRPPVRGRQDARLWLHRE